MLKNYKGVVAGKFFILDKGKEVEYPDELAVKFIANGLAESLGKDNAKPVNKDNAKKGK